MLQAGEVMSSAWKAQFDDAISKWSVFKGNVPHEKKIASPQEGDLAVINNRIMLRANGQWKEAFAGLPRGTIVMWSGPTIPEGWALCDGTNGTPDLRDRFILGAGGSYSVGATGGAESVSHSHTSLRDLGVYKRAKGGGDITYYLKHGHPITTSTATIPILPPYYALYFIMKL